jgi:ubiquitin-protein ligase E3 C
MLSDLSTIDKQLYNNILFLKTYEDDAEDLCLTFTITNGDFGRNRELPLIPNGQNVSVTNENKQRYIGLVAKHYIVDRQKEQSEAFTRGLWEVISPSWLKIFNEPELQVRFWSFTSKFFTPLLPFSLTSMFDCSTYRFLLVVPLMD